MFPFRYHKSMSWKFFDDIFDNYVVVKKLVDMPSDNVRLLNLAIAQADNALPISSQRVGAVIVNKRGHILSQTHNIMKTHPMIKRFSTNGKRPYVLHAETRAIILTKRFIEQSDAIYVARKTKGGMLSAARPCPSCMLAIMETNINKVVFSVDTNHYGVLDIAKIRETGAFND